jgi:hypothetical protein
MDTIPTQKIEDHDAEIRNLNAILDRMSDKTREMNLTGVSVAGVFGQNRNLLSQSRDCGKLFNTNWNYLAVALSKIAEMCDTLADSGSPSRNEVQGEFGYEGGTIRQAGDKFYVSAFSGAKGEEDLVIAKFGIEII